MVNSESPVTNLRRMFCQSSELQIENTRPCRFLCFWKQTVPPLYLVAPSSNLNERQLSRTDTH